MIASPCRSIPVFALVVALLASACSAGVVGSSPTSGSSTVPAVTPGAPSTPTPGTASGPDVVPLTAGTRAAHVLGGDRETEYTVAVPAGWFEFGGRFVIKYPGDKPGPVLGLSVWDVGQVYLDPCRWRSGQVDPGPSVKALVAALVAQPMRNASKPTAVTLAGSQGTYLELSVPADLKSSTWTDFDACDLEPSNGHHDFRSWIGNGLGTRYLQVPGQVDRLWVLDVKGQRLVVDATYSPDTTQADREELTRVVESLRFGS